MTDFYRLSWSLAVEEWFYYAFPLALLLMIGLGAGVRRAAAVTVGLFIVVPFMARLGMPVHTDRYDDARYIVLFRLDAIGGGVAMAYLYTWHRSIFDRFVKYWYIPLALVIAIIALTKQGWPWTLNNNVALSVFFTCSAVFFAALVPLFFSLRPSRWTLVNRFVKFTSLISYSIYLGHIFAFILVISVLNRLGLYDSVYNNPWLVYPIFSACIYGLAYATYTLVEKPFLKLRDIDGFSLFKLLKSLQRLGAGK
jgi:peptidoglycan/LPS O-acetylase OafA/YrhL